MVIGHIAAARRRRGSAGFTLIELLVVIAILGVLAAVVTFSVRGVTDRGESAAESTDRRILRTAEEAFRAQHGFYGTEAQLEAAGFLADQSEVTDIAVSPDGQSYQFGYGQPNDGQGSSIDHLTLSATAGTQFGYPYPFGYSRGPGHLNTNYMFDPLLWRDATGFPIPWLATEVPTVANGGITNGATTYTFKLRSGVKWHDGQPFTAEDVKFTVDYQTTGAGAAVTPCFCNSALPGIASVTVDSPTQVTFHLTGPSNIFLTYIGQQMVIIPKHIWEGITNPNAQQANPLAYVGTGPYKPVDPPAGQYNPTTGVQKYAANPDFFLGVPYVRELRFVTAGDAIAALKNRVVDAGGVGSEEGVTDAALAQLSGLPRVENPGGWNRAFHFNPLRGFPYNRVKFRQAVAYAIDRQALLTNIVGGRGVVGSLGNLTPSNPWFKTGLPTYDNGTRASNVAAAKALLDDLGIVDTNGDGFRECPASSPCQVVSGGNSGAPTITAVSTPANFVPNIHTSPSFNGNTATAIKQYLADVGIDSAVVPDASGPASDTRMRNGNYGLGIVGWGNLQSDPDSLRTRLDHNYTGPLMGSVNGSFTAIYGWTGAASQPTTTPGYATHADEFQALAAQQLTEPDPAVRKQKVHRMQEVVAADVPMISLYVPRATQFYHSDSLTAWYYTPGGTPPGPPGFLNKHVFVTGKQFGLP